MKSIVDYVCVQIGSMGLNEDKTMILRGLLESPSMLEIVGANKIREEVKGTLFTNLKNAFQNITKNSDDIDLRR